MSITTILCGLFVLVIVYLYMFDTLNPTIVGQALLALVGLGLLMYWISPMYTTHRNNSIHHHQNHQKQHKQHQECVGEIV
jgi:O-antigen/teichoic acid export membrane protein